MDNIPYSFVLLLFTCHICVLLDLFCIISISIVSYYYKTPIIKLFNSKADAFYNIFCISDIVSFVVGVCQVYF